MSALPLLDGYEDTIADLAVDRLGEVTFAGRVFDQEHLAGADPAGFAVARGNLDAGIEIDDVLAPRCGMPVEVISRRDFSENNAGRRQTRGQFTRAGFLDPFDFDIPEM